MRYKRFAIHFTMILLFLFSLNTVMVFASAEGTYSSSYSGPSNIMKLTGTDVFAFNVADNGADEKPILLDGIYIKVVESGGANANTIISSATLSGGGLTNESAASIGADSILFGEEDTSGGAATLDTIADGGNATYTLNITLNSSATAGNTITFSVDVDDEPSGFQVDSFGEYSSSSTIDGASVSSNAINVIEWIPTLTQWGVIIFIILMGGIAILALKKRKQQPEWV